MRYFLSVAGLILFITVVGLLSYYKGAKDEAQILGAKTVVLNKTLSPFPSPSPLVTWPPSAAPAKAVTIAQPPAPRVVVDNFYQWYLRCVQNHSQTKSTSTIQQDCDYSNNTALSDSLKQDLSNMKGYNSILCSQNVPNSIQTDQKQSLFNGLASTSVTEDFGTQKQTVNVELKLLNNKWQINTITCPKPI